MANEHSARADTSCNTGVHRWSGRNSPNNKRGIAGGGGASAGVANWPTHHSASGKSPSWATRRPTDAAPPPPQRSHR
eukprot:7334337-Alexandrium_andersonii.AAC.1